MTSRIIDGGDGAAVENEGADLRTIFAYRVDLIGAVADPRSKVSEDGFGGACAARTADRVEFPGSGRNVMQHPRFARASVVLIAS
jgi:hypothetical protein